MIIEKTVGLGTNAVTNPGKYKAFFGISLRNKFFSKKTLLEYFKWAENQFSEVVILLMDDPDMHNFKVFKNLTDEAALIKAREISDTLVKGYQKNLSLINSKKIRVIQFKDFKDDAKYIQILASISQYMKENEEFKKSLYSLMETNIGKRIVAFCEEKNLSPDEIAQVKESLLQYIVEELASIIYFTEQGYVIELDPTVEFETKKLLYEGHFPEFNKLFPLGERGHIFVYPEGTSYYKKTYEE